MLSSHGSLLRCVLIIKGSCNVPIFVTQDEDLATILREYVAKQRVLPGVQSSRDVSWPQTQRSRALPQGSSNNGGDYVATRRSLLAHYAVPWLQALHNEEPETYTDMLFDICLDTSQESLTTYDVLHPKPRASVNPDVNSGKHLDKLLRLIIRLSQNSITFAILDDLFNRWLDVVANLPSFKDVCQKFHLVPKCIDRAISLYRRCCVCYLARTRTLIA